MDVGSLVAQDAQDYAPADDNSYGFTTDGSGVSSSTSFDPGTDTSFNQPPQVITTDAAGAQEQAVRGTGTSTNTNDSWGPFANALGALALGTGAAWSRYAVDRARANSGLAPDFYATGSMVRDPRSGQLVPVLPGKTGYRTVGSTPNGMILIVLAVVVIAVAAKE
ncbi:hypothetical protein BGV68_01895 [Burkholderia ubonensis]|nr:hypothetical protein BGV68_01895 [Burkholderia ubonensis]